MSDSDGDFSDELLELAGATEKKNKRSQQRSAKRRKPDSRSTSSENEYESEEDFVNPYPLEGKYKDEVDRLLLQRLPEIEREKEIASRLEEIQRITDKRNLDRMLRAQSQRAGDSADAVSRAAKRTHSQRGATKEKSMKLDELKAKRKAKGDKKRQRLNSPKRERSSSPMDMEMSDDESEDGQITKYEQEEEREQRLAGKAKQEDEEITLSDLLTCQLTRTLLCKYAYHPWFDEYVKGSYVRYLIGNDQNGPVYRICQIVNTDAKPTRPYKVDGNSYDQLLWLKQGKSEKTFPFDRVSNAPFQDNEFRWFVQNNLAEQVKLPMKRMLAKKAEQLQKLPSQALTNKEIDFILARKQALHQSPTMTPLSATLRKQRLYQAHRHAVMRGDMSEAFEIEKQIKEVEAIIKNMALDSDDGGEGRSYDLLAKVNERNRRANLELVRQAEAEEAERRKKERKARFLAVQARNRIWAQQARAGSGSRNGTPGAAISAPKTVRETLLSALSTPGRSISPMPPPSGPSTKKQRLETMMAEQVEVDLGDF